MIPQWLSLEGLYSYQAPVTIDFRPLTAARLFGIFGSVGSGKSTILEAMTLALYGESARLNRNDNRSSNLLNLRSDRLAVDFRFLNRDGDTYRFTVEIKRRRKNPEEAGTMSRSAYRLDAGSDEWVPLDHVDGERVLGLSYQNFRRTTIIPQGRFQEFLQLGPADRTEMMQELFRLDRFDLSQRTRTLLASAKEELHGVRSALGELPDDLDADIAQIGTEQEAARGRRAEIASALESASARRERVLWTLERYRQLEDADAERGAAGHDLAEADRLAERIAILAEVRDRVRGPWERRDDARRRETDAAGLLQESVDQRPERVAAVASAREAVERAARLRSRRPALEGLLRLLETTDEVASVAAERDALAEREAAARRTRDTVSGQIQEFESALAELREGLPERAVLTELAAVVQEERHDRAARETIADRRRRALEEIDAPAADLDSVHRMREEAEAERRRLQGVARAAGVHAEIAAIRDTLTEGSPCPVCGATHHPAVAHGDAAPDTGDGRDVPGEDELEALEGRIASLIRAEGTLRDAAEEEAARPAVATSDHREVLSPDPDTAAAEVEDAWDRYARIDARRATLDDLLRRKSEADTAVASTAARREERDVRLEDLRRTVTTQSGALDEEARAAYDRVRDGSPDDRRALATRVRTAMDRAEADHVAADEALRAAERAAERRDQQEEERRAAVERVAAERTAAETELRAVTDRDDDELAELIGDLPRLPEYEAREEEIRERHRRLVERTAAIRAELRAAGEDIAPSFDLSSVPSSDASSDAAASSIARRRELEDEQSHLDGRISALESERARVDETLGSLTARRETAEAQVRRRDDLRVRESDLDVRVRNLSVLADLFRARGFVGYVAHVYLQQLVSAANDRFRRLTRNQLELAMTGDREFTVIDALNGGRRRSVKTLSGGQTFQAALCLALALVDSIDHGSGDQPAFFFLDEGFGSLDGESLRDVFDTLKDLRRENRIVGVISHVEALQEEIDSSILVRLDEDRGSQITTSA